MQENNKYNLIIPDLLEIEQFTHMCMNDFFVWLKKILNHARSSLKHDASCLLCDIMIYYMLSGGL
jgi:hypothetical protein